MFHHRFDLFTCQLWVRLEALVAFENVVLVFGYVVGFHGLEARYPLIQVELKHIPEQLGNVILFLLTIKFHSVELEEILGVF